MNTLNYIKQKQEHIESLFNQVLPPEDHNSLYQAMRYAVMGHGKRFRPLLAYATQESLASEPNKSADYAAIAVELVHSYSLIHDDLPAMDDDDLRHGKPSCHKKFGEAIAILAGDALLSFAFEILSQESLGINAELQMRLIRELARASGPKGMVLGQALDLNPEEAASIAALQTVHIHKTGALIQASVLMGAFAAGCEDPAMLESLRAFGHDLGLAYQIQDDILDLEASSEHLGKPAQSDIKNGKQTYPVLSGIAESKIQAHHLYREALNHLKKIQLDDSPLAKLAQHFIERRK